MRIYRRHIFHWSGEGPNKRTIDWLISPKSSTMTWKKQIEYETDPIFWRMAKCADYGSNKRICSPTPPVPCTPFKAYSYLLEANTISMSRKRLWFLVPARGKNENESRATFVNDFQCIYFFNLFASDMDVPAAASAVAPGATEVQLSLSRWEFTGRSRHIIICKTVSMRHYANAKYKKMDNVRSFAGKAFSLGQRLCRCLCEAIYSDIWKYATISDPKRRNFGRP